MSTADSAPPDRTYTHPTITGRPYTSPSGAVGDALSRYSNLDAMRGSVKIEIVMDIGDEGCYIPHMKVTQ